MTDINAWRIDTTHEARDEGNHPATEPSGNLP